jgi:hypothetical protein
MSFNKSWTFLINHLPEDSSTIGKITQHYLLKLSQFLIANGWTAVSSSNGVTAGNTNLWTQPSDIVLATSSQAHSHLVLRSPIGFIPGPDGTSLGAQSQVYLTISAGNANNNQPNSLVYATFIQHLALPTGGTTTANPSSSDQVSSGVQISRTSIGQQPNFHFACTTQGHFWSGISYSGTNSMPLFIAVLPFETIRTRVSTGKLYPYPYFFSWGNSDNPNHPSNSILSGMGGFTATGHATNACYGLFLGVGGSQQDGDIDTQFIFSPIYVEVTATNEAFLVGKVADLEIRNSVVRQNGSVDSLTNITRVYVGQMALPCNSVINV